MKKRIKAKKPVKKVSAKKKPAAKKKAAPKTVRDEMAKRETKVDAPAYPGSSGFPD